MDEPGPMELIPSMLMESWVGKVPATEMFPWESVCTPGCAVNVDMALVEPWERVVMATGRSTNSRDPFVSATLDVSVSITAAEASTFTVVVWLAIDSSASCRLVSRAPRSKDVNSSFRKPVASTVEFVRPDFQIHELVSARVTGNG